MFRIVGFRICPKDAGVWLETHLFQHSMGLTCKSPDISPPPNEDHPLFDHRIKQLWVRLARTVRTARITASLCPAAGSDRVLLFDQGKTPRGCMGSSQERETLSKVTWRLIPLLFLCFNSGIE
jgi:hypothetical protein